MLLTRFTQKSPGLLEVTMTGFPEEASGLDLALTSDSRGRGLIPQVLTFPKDQEEEAGGVAEVLEVLRASLVEEDSEGSCDFL